ncbi:bifunctional protein-disulfide isomerase/oxidoreductase DsbC [Enterovibrio norvegicus FF-33]|uniref:Thiol:disulfide interchange protein n=1 Tax=Enterovibrio norvegicus FF-454 TaxID=1185651 RepID=A0A1E5BWK3_9GAMM|nr:bifunctional protein-disulfide isomerase/oxidoreductase DsbC [Enterovibrio norvegicus]OEE57590.1 bifunctional protein-disulfide isomerase/oxidoreductase DsbC [Enterovibrio norvegicus FF-454]OEE69713.1 bifunctional protein-disulfide isomerase/oxidoreductase DsbC [Enterovibrio norvegicus FF-33]OEE85639.1 bifunctional protein-disulfide isomerase/oxidoreductase DsbC [Enterovibrio norvegicus FF-162]
MNFKQLLAGVMLSSALFSFGAQAVEGADKAAISDVLAQYRLNIESIEASPVEGLFEVITNGGVVYANKDGSYFIYGQLFHTNEKESINLTEIAQAKRNKKLFDAAGVEKELIVYPAKNEKHIVNVYTDTTCGYCMKLHREMQDYNDLGITVRYLAFPRSGERSPNMEQMSAIWCADDRAVAMNAAKAGDFNKETDACNDLVRRHMALGTSMGVSGTPAIMLQDGTMLSGYLPAPKLLEVLQQKG